MSNLVLDKTARSQAACRSRGLTLIELMVVVAILAILATIAVPTYERYQLGARRADGKAALMAVAQAQERAFSIYQRYVKLSSLDDLAGLDKDLADSGKSPKDKYSIAFATQTTTEFTVEATPKFTDADCDKLQLTSTGQRKATGPKGTDCW